MPRHPSQLYEAFLEGALLFVVMWWLATRLGWLKTPGALIGVFLVGYGGGRSLVEMVRQPDRFLTSPDNPLGLAVQWGTTSGLTTGQLLSLPMLVTGIAVVLWARRSAERARARGRSTAPGRRSRRCCRSCGGRDRGRS